MEREKIIFRNHEPITGQPDIFIEPNICIFCDGDYWHGHKDLLVDRMPDIIQRKSITRDEFVDKTLESQGYIVLRFWEHEIKKNLDNCIFLIKSNLYYYNF